MSLFRITNVKTGESWVKYIPDRGSERTYLLAVWTATGEFDLNEIDG